MMFENYLKRLMAISIPRSFSIAQLKAHTAEKLLPQGTSLVLLRSAPPIITTMRYWLHRPEAETLLAQRAEVEAIMRPGTAGIGEATVTDD